MSSPLPAVISWSGGKDSALALYRTLRDRTFDVQALITTVTDDYDRISMHGVRRELLVKQADAIGIPLVIASIPSEASNEIYEAAMAEALTPFRDSGNSTVICGDLFLEDIRAYRERLFGAIGMTGVFPLWLEDTRDLAREFIDLGFKAIICSADPLKVSDGTCGANYGFDLLERLPPACDPCGENGEFHTFVYDGPIFQHAVNLSHGATVTRDGFCFTDLIPVSG